MATGSREGSIDQDSASRLSSVPMWDSSDPDRAPPPLPLNPGTNGSPTCKANTSAGIAAAVKQIVEKARESAPISSYTTNQVSFGSPERSLIKGAHHKRMQSLQTGSVKDLRSYLDSNRSPERSPERPHSRSSFTLHGRQTSMEDLSATPDRCTTPTPLARDSIKDTPVLRPSTRQPPRAILGENTPPSATMLALQTMQIPDIPLGDITNASSANSAPKVHVNHDFSGQLFNLTSIATSLQKEMAQLSRRSKDNATDLISLKEATNARDEDIRKSLRELATSVNTTQVLLGPQSILPTPRRYSGYGNSSTLDKGIFSSPPSATKGFPGPRSQSAHGFLDEPRCGSPSPYSVEGAASVAMLEKIIREMVTKEGQERLLSNLAELLEKSREENGEAARKVEELSDFIKERSVSQALVHVKSREEEAQAETRDIKKSGDSSVQQSPGLATEEMLKALQRIRDSVANSGGMTSEVKGLLRDMRGEVLGTGRDLGKKLDTLLEGQLNKDLDNTISDGNFSQHADEVHRIVEDGLNDLKSHLAQMLQQRNERDDDAFRQIATTRSTSDSDQMLSVVQHALAEHSRSREQDMPENVRSDLDRDGVLDAVKEGLKDFEPNIELQQFGLERDEILAVLKEGLEDYQNSRSEPAPSSINKGEIYEVMQEALKDFQAPLPSDQIAQMKDELLEDVRTALADFQPTQTDAQFDSERMHAAVLDAVKAGLAEQEPAPPREFDISREDLFDAVKASLDGTTIPFGGLGEQVLQQLQELFEGMRVEFKQYSAANGRDTEQVLDAVKDGLESLRAEIETYVDRAQDVTGKDEIVDTVKGGLEQLRGDVQSYCLQGAAHDGGKAEMLEYIKAEFEQLHDAIASHNEGSRGLDDAKPNHVAEIILAFNQGMDALRDHVETRSVDRSLDDPSLEELSEAMRVEFEQLKGALLHAHATDKNELLETIQDSIGALHTRLNGSELGSVSSGFSADVSQIVQQELATLKENIHAMVSEVSTDAIIDGVRESMDSFRRQLSSDQSGYSSELLAVLKGEFEKFNESFGSAMVLGRGSGENGESLDAIKTGLEDVKAEIISASAKGISDEQLEAFRGEFENIRVAIANNSARGGSNEEVLDAVRLGLDDLRSHLEKKLDNPESVISHQSNVLDALHDGLENLRGDIVKTLDKPLDMTVNYEILETLKAGLSEIRSDMSQIGSGKSRPATSQGGQIVLAENSEFSGTRDLSGEAPPVVPVSSFQKNDLEKLEVLLAQLQIKVEAMDHTLQDMPAPQQADHDSFQASFRDGLSNVENMIRGLQDTVTASNPSIELATEGLAKKDDTDAIETLLRIAKSQLDELVSKDTPGGAIDQEHMDTILAANRMTSDTVEALADKLASKEDVTVVEMLVQDLKTTLEDLKDKSSAAASDEDKADAITKVDLDVLGVLITEIKASVAGLNLSEGDVLPTKSHIEDLHAMISEFRESHDKMRDSYETDIAVTARAFDDRKREFDDTISQIAEVKALLDVTKLELMDKLSEGEVGINTLGVALKAVEANTSNEQITSEIKEFLEKVKDEFERTHSALEEVKSDNARVAESTSEKQAEHKEVLVAELTVKLDTLFDGLMTKYDDAQHAAEEKAKVMEDKAAEQEELMNVTKMMTDDLKLSIDTLGTTLSEFMGDLPSTVEKMAEESKTVFTQVEQTHGKLEETADSLRGEHALTRDQLAQLLAAVDGVQGDLTENHPRFMVTLEEVRALITQHYAHSQKSSEATAEHTRAVKELQDALKAGFEDSRARTEGLKTQQEELKTTLPALMPPPIEAPREVERYDDSTMQEKLDKLMGHVEDTAKRTAQISRLDEIHDKVMATAAEVTAFVAAQNQQITATHEIREKDAEELALLLERRLERKDQLEADITVLNEEKESLQLAVEALKAEKEALLAQKARLNADVSSMETAIHIRRDELHDMDEKAHAIERRIMEGAMHQSRMLLLAKTTKPPSPKKKPQGRDLRVTSNGSTVSAHTVTSTASSALKTSHALVMNSARPNVQRNTGFPAAGERRIMSLNQIHHNQAPTPMTEKPSLAKTGGNSLANMKRSQSVKTVAFNRRLSWAPGKTRTNRPSIHNKENENDTLSEEDEEYSQANESRLDDHTSETGRYRPSIDGTDAGDTYATGSYISDDETNESVDHRRTSYGTYDSGTGSHVTQAELDRHPSVGSSMKGTVGTCTRMDDDDGDREDSEALRPPPRFTEAGMVKYAPPSDSGLGTDLPSAMASGGEEEYYHRY